MKEIRFLIDWRGKFKKGDIVNFDDKGADEFVRLKYAELIDSKVYSEKDRKQNISYKGSNPPLKSASSKGEKILTARASSGNSSKGGKNTILENIYQGFPPKLKAELHSFLNDNKGNVCFFSKEVFPRADWSFIRKMSLSVSSSKNRLVFVGVLNHVSRLRSIAMNVENKVKLALLSSVRNNFYFFNEIPRKDIFFDNQCVIQCNEYIGILDEKAVICYYDGMLKDGFEYMIKAVQVPMPTTKKVLNSVLNIQEDTYIILEAEQIIEDYGILRKVIPYLKNIQQLSMVWDYANNKPLYTDIEVWIITINTFFVESGCDAMNLILCGEGGTKKTTWCRILSYIFDDPVVMMTLSTSKGIVPSFYGDKPQLGSLLEAKFVALLDDYFRFFSQQSAHVGILSSIRTGLEQTMNLLDRETYEIPNPKQNRYRVTFRSSFLATDNYQYIDELRKLFSNNSALLRRYSFLILDKNTVQNSTEMEEEAMNNIKAFTVKRFSESLRVDEPWLALKVLFKFMRENAHKAVYDSEKVKEISSRVRLKYNFPAHTYFGSKVTALIHGIVCLNAIFRANDINQVNFQAMPEDYAIFERLIDRILYDYYYMLVSDVTIQDKQPDSNSDNPNNINSYIPKTIDEDVK